MENTDQNYDSFLESLGKMNTLFSDQMDATRLDLYWELLAPRVELEEWHYACYQAMLREGFHKVPLPDALLGYVREYREAEATTRHQARQALEAADAAQRFARQLAYEEEVRLKRLEEDAQRTAAAKANGEHWPQTIRGFGRIEPLYEPKPEEAL
jgi:hypothetical protein